MKRLLIALALLSLALQCFTAPVHAQGRHRPSDGNAAPSNSDTKKRQDAEAKAAKAAMDKIPDSKEKYDPWKIVPDRAK